MGFKRRYEREDTGPTFSTHDLAVINRHLLLRLTSLMERYMTVLDDLKTSQDKATANVTRLEASFAALSAKVAAGGGGVPEADLAPIVTAFDDLSARAAALADQADALVNPPAPPAQP